MTQQDIKASKYNIDASKYNKYQSLNIKWNIRIVRPQNTKAHRDMRSQYIKKVVFFGEKQNSPKTKKNMSTLMLFLVLKDEECVQCGEA